jgi:iron complex outermembrane recepter protein
VSVDYYSIDLEDAIASLTGQQVVDGCFSGQTSLCGQITRGADGFISSVQATLLNTAETKTSGVDLEVGYSYALGAGQLNVRLLSTYVDKLVNTIANVPTDRAGQVGSGAGIPHWRGNLGVNYRVAKYEAGILYRYVQGGKYDNTFIEVDGTSNLNSINDNTVSGRGYIDLNGSYKVTENFDLFAKVNNLLDKDPPATPNVITQTIYASAPFYDRTGLYYIAGVRLRF